MYFILSALWLFIALYNVFMKRSGIVIGYNVLAAVLFALLGITQFVCSKKGQKGRQILRVVQTAAVILIAVLLLVLVLTALHN